MHGVVFIHVCASWPGSDLDQTNQNVVDVSPPNTC